MTDRDFERLFPEIAAGVRGLVSDKLKQSLDALLSKGMTPPMVWDVVKAMIRKNGGQEHGLFGSGVKTYLGLDQAGELPDSVHVVTEEDLL